MAFVELHKLLFVFLFTSMRRATLKNGAVIKRLSHSDVNILSSEDDRHLHDKISHIRDTVGKSAMLLKDYSKLDLYELGGIGNLNRRDTTNKYSNAAIISFENTNGLEKGNDGNNHDSGSGYMININLAPDRIISVMMYSFLVFTGIYMTIFGFRIFRLSMIILGFYVGYYMIIFILTETLVYEPNNVGHQLCLFFSCITIGFIISVACFKYKKINSIVFGTALGSVITLFYAQFFINFGDDGSNPHLLLFYFASCTICSLVVFFVLDQTIIIGSVFAGASIAVINIGVIFNGLMSFEDREPLPHRSFDLFKSYILIIGLFFVLGVCSQFYLRSLVISRFNEKNTDDIPNASLVY